jgi:plasmid replication initiation protein
MASPTKTVKRRVVRQNTGIKLIRKSNSLIEARYNFSIWEARLFSKVLTLISMEDTDFQVFRVFLKDVINDFMLQKDNASYDLFRKAAEDLMSKKFYVPYEVDGAIREKKYPIIIMADYMKEALNAKSRKANEYLDISIHPEMKPLLLELRERFTSYDLRNIIKFRSTYALRIYEHLKQYERIGRRTLEIDYLRRIFEMSTEYPLFANFFQKVIKPSERDINLFTDLTITKIGKIKQGKKVVALLFDFQPKSKESIREIRKDWEPAQAALSLRFGKDDGFEEAETVDADEQEEILMTEKDRLFQLYQADVVEGFGVTPSSFINILEGRTEEEVHRAIRVTRRAKANNTVKSSVAGFFVQALKNGYADEKEVQVRKKEKEQAIKIKIEALKKELSGLRDEQAAKINQRIKEITTENPATTGGAIEAIRQNTLAKVFVEKKEMKLGRALEIEDFRQDKMLRDMVKRTIFEAHKSRFLDILEVFEPKIRALEEQMKERFL